jgi:diadenylate cyclase
MAMWEFIKSIGWSSYLDISIMAVLIYMVLVWFKKTKAAFVLVGILIISAMYLVARQLDLRLIEFVFRGFFAVILVALVVIFQEELKHFFERLAVFSLNRGSMSARVLSPSHEWSTILARTATDLAREKIGALIVLRGRDPIDRHLDSGTQLGGTLSEPLLKSIFDPHSIGHDGAVVIENGKVIGFSYHLPLSTALSKLRRTGTRHAAALGLAELSDALCLVVSEERGTISIARNGEIRTLTDPGELIALLQSFYEELSPKRTAPKRFEMLSSHSREKVLAVVISFAMWFVFVHESLVIYRSYQVPVKCVNIPKGMKIAKKDPNQITVTLNGPRRNFYFMSAGKIKVLLPIYDTHPGKNRVTMLESNITSPNGLSIVNIDPDSIRVDLVPVGSAAAAEAEAAAESVAAPAMMPPNVV